MKPRSSLGVALCLASCCLVPSIRGDDFAVPLPDGVQAVWDLDLAHRESTATRERISINGLWRWQPAGAVPEATPEESWGYFKVPGWWPGITDYLQKDSQTLHRHPEWKDRRLAEVSAAWYEREITIPAAWSGRRIALEVEYLNSLAVAYLDGKRAGELRFPGGLILLSPHCVPGKTHRLTLHVAAVPLKGVLLSYQDSNAARSVAGRVARRGLCGDVSILSEPTKERITDLKVDTSFRQGEIRFECALDGLSAGVQYSLEARVSEGGEERRAFSSAPFEASALTEGRLAFDARWRPERLWDINTPENSYEVTLSLRRTDGDLLDRSLAQRFGFREFWIDGKDFYLNGSRIFLSAVPLDNAQVSARHASYEGARESLRRLKSFGINFVYTHNYGCQPGTHASFREILRAADDEGMLVAVSQPHFSHYEWPGPPEGPDPHDPKSSYARHAEFYVRAAQDHPSVVAYSMSHNACGYAEDMNPDEIDGLRDPRQTSWERRNAGRAQRAEAIVRAFDPSRIVYHHAGGHIGAMHTVNFYPNFVPIQEMSDWFGHWTREGVKPAFLCEYGAPFLWDWAMYRGWYEGKREFGSARVPWDYCLQEWNAQFLGDRAFKVSEREKANLRWEAKQFRAGRLWHRWDYPESLGSSAFPERYEIIARYIRDNWRAFRTWGLSAFSPWEHGAYWRLRPGVDRGPKELEVDWRMLQRPGFSADFEDRRYERMDLAYEAKDWEPTAAAEALLRNNLPLLAYIAGRPGAFTAKDHVFLAGETIVKQLVVLNNSRRPVSCDVDWSLALPTPLGGRRTLRVETGQEGRIPLSFALPPQTPPGSYTLGARFRFAGGPTQDDAFEVQVLPPPRSARVSAKIALFDPPGETRALLKRRGVAFQAVAAEADLSGYDLLLIGKKALTVDGPGPDIARVREGLRVIIFEQPARVLEQRFGFRVAEYGLREVFARVPDHPVLDDLEPEHLRDWRGASTLEPPQLEYSLRPRHGPTVRWCGIEVPRLWRCGNRGNVASVLLEKPARGDFLPILDGGYSLQYSPLLEYREGRGVVIFCQLDITGRSERDPVAETISSSLLSYTLSWRAPTPSRRAVYLGEPAGRRHLESAGVGLDPYAGNLSPERVLVVGPGGGKELAKDHGKIADWLSAGGQLLAIGLVEAELAFLPSKVGIVSREHIAAFFEAPSLASFARGVGPADVHNRDPRSLSLVSSGAEILAGGVLAEAKDHAVIFCALAPWHFDPEKQWNLKKTFRRTSYLVTRLLSNLGATSETPLLERVHAGVSAEEPPRWQSGLYLDQPEEWDDPYRFFRW